MTQPSTTTPTATTYDAVPYSISAFRQTDPDRLAVLARIFGLTSERPQNCRVLELGCASGGNLIPMALAYPGSHFVGIDLSQRQIEEGNVIVRQLGLPNLELRHLSISDVDASLGQFDYILAHGVYSWVPPAVQERILEVCRDNMTATGVAYISYNTYPGWHTRGAIREMLVYHTSDVPDPVEKIRVAREHLKFLAQFYGASKTPFHAALAHELTLLMDKTPDTYLLHEYLETFNEPLYFHEFVARAAARGLQYLAEAEIASMLPARFGADVEKVLRSMSSHPLELEQAMDFLRTRMFRQTLLCHANERLDHTLRTDAVPSLYVASMMRAESAAIDIATEKPEAFVALNRPKLTTRAPLMKAALYTLSQHWPMPILFSELLAKVHAALGRQKAEDAAELSQGLLNCYTAGVVEFSVAPPRFVMHVSERPVTSPYVRHRASLSDEVSNMRMENIALTEPARLVLSHLDGAHDKASLVALVAELLEKHPKPGSTESPHDRAVRYIDYILPNFAKSALLTA
jgi:methyltransferase-like protein/SAM-dependent methyltransferase